jgi:tetratricopeptide (TPR) repeat protein
LFIHYAELSLWHYLFFNIVYAFIFSCIWYYAFIDKVTSVRILLFLFSFTLISTLPLLGNLLIVILTPWLALVKKVAKGPSIQVVETPMFQYEGDVKTDITVGSMWGAKIDLNSERTASAEKMRALTILNAVSTPASMHVNEQTLKHRDDEVRLYAFALMNTKEKQIERQISVILKQLSVNKDTTQRALFQKSLAALYWELIYYGFISNDLLEFTLSKALKYATEAIDVLPNDVALCVLLGRLYNKQNKLDEAIGAFERAVELKVPIYRVAPYLAEVYFKKGDYAKVREYLQKDVSLQQVMNLSGCVKFWTIKQAQTQTAGGEDDKQGSQQPQSEAS